MDIVSHVLWSVLLAQATGSPAYAVLAGTLPDLLAFIPVFAYQLVRRAPVGDYPEAYAALPAGLRRYAESVYCVTHSLVVFALVATAVWLAWGVQWWLLAWPLHILIDIPTHSKSFYPTPFLWPLSRATVDGIPWTDRRIMLANVALLAAGYAAMLFFP